MNSLCGIAGTVKKCLSCKEDEINTRVSSPIAREILNKPNNPFEDGA
jgi:hypothetical protein